MSLKNSAGGVLLIAGTTIGAAVIVLPVGTAHLGFNLATLYFLVCWFFMTIGALYVLEANLQVGYGTNLISMAKPTLGLTGQIITWFMYLLLLYSLTAAYLTGAGAWMAKLLSAWNFEQASNSAIPIGALLVSILVSGMLILGAHTIDLINRVLMVFLLGAIITIFIIAMPHTNSQLLFEQSTQLDLKPLPLIITGFGFAIIVPSLTEYLHGKAQQLKHVILIGSLVPLVLYLLWEMVILGIIPQQGPTSLMQMRMIGHPATDLPQTLSVLLNQSSLTLAAQIFSIFALTTSILGVSLSLFDFLADGLNLKKTFRDKWLLSAITFIPPLFFVALYPQGFEHVLRFAGIFVCFILGLLPALMVYVGRYVKPIQHRHLVFGGKTLICLTILFFSFVCIIEFFSWFGFEFLF